MVLKHAVLALQAPEQKRLLELVKAVEIHTEEHRIIYDIWAER